MLCCSPVLESNTSGPLILLLVYRHLSLVLRMTSASVIFSVFSLSLQILDMVVCLFNTSVFLSAFVRLCFGSLNTYLEKCSYYLKMFIEFSPFLSGIRVLYNFKLSYIMLFFLIIIYHFSFLLFSVYYSVDSLVNRFFLSKFCVSYYSFPWSQYFLGQTTHSDCFFPTLLLFHLLSFFCLIHTLWTLVYPFLPHVTHFIKRKLHNMLEPQNTIT